MLLIPSSVTVQTGFYQTWSETLKDSPHELNFLNSLLTWLKLSYLVLKFGLTLNYCLIPSEH